MRPLRFAFFLACLALLLAPALLPAQKWHKGHSTPPLFIPAERGVDMPYIQDGGQIVLGDFDRDGDLDVLLACFYAQSRLFFNDGKGHMTEVTKGHVPEGILTARDQGVEAGDVDGDGDLDILISNGDVPGESDGNLTLWLNNGNGGFRAAGFNVASLANDGQWHDSVQLMEFPETGGSSSLTMVVVPGMQPLKELLYLGRDTWWKGFIR